jgi:hypothetical protein
LADIRLNLCCRINSSNPDLIQSLIPQSHNPLNPTIFRHPGDPEPGV